MEKKYRFMNWEKPLFILDGDKFRPEEDCLVDYVDIKQSHLFTEVIDPPPC